jgi:hypothetical protein
MVTIFKVVKREDDGKCYEKHNLMCWECFLYEGMIINKKLHEKLCKCINCTTCAEFRLKKIDVFEQGDWEDLEKINFENIKGIITKFLAFDNNYRQFYFSYMKQIGFDSVILLLAKCQDQDSENSLHFLKFSYKKYKNYIHENGYINLVLGTPKILSIVKDKLIYLTCQIRDLIQNSFIENLQDKQDILNFIDLYIDYNISLCNETKEKLIYFNIKKYVELLSK